MRIADCWLLGIVCPFKKTALINSKRTPSNTMYPADGRPKEVAQIPGNLNVYKRAMGLEDLQIVATTCKRFWKHGPRGAKATLSR